MNRSYNHVKHLVDNNEAVLNNKQWPGVCGWINDPKHYANYLNDKQRHTGLDYYEYDMP